MAGSVGNLRKGGKQLPYQDRKRRKLAFFGKFQGNLFQRKIEVALTFLKREIFFTSREARFLRDAEIPPGPNVRGKREDHRRSRSEARAGFIQTMGGREVEDRRRFLKPEVRK
jgi:hypothetical protein